MARTTEQATREEPPVLKQAPRLDPAWLAHEQEANLLAPKAAIDPIKRQPLYAAECRQRNGAMMAPGAREHSLSLGIATKYLSVPSSKDDHAIPVLQYDRIPDADGKTGNGGDNARSVVVGPEWVLVYYHGGGLLVGEADSEDLSCRRLVKDSAPFMPNLRLYSVGYRLKPQHPASTCVSDSVDAFVSLAKHHPGANIVVVGSSSGGQLAALVTQHALRAGIALHGVLLRCPVTSDAFRGQEYVPLHLRDMHTSAHHKSFATSLFTRLDTDGPRDGLNRMPLEVDGGELKGMPRTWVQLCTNDGLYSDGACYVKVLRDAGIEVRTDIVWGWPHTFWLKAPQLERALEADQAMMEGLAWVVSVK